MNSSPMYGILPIRANIIAINTKKRTMIEIEICVKIGACQCFFTNLKASDEE